MPDKQLILVVEDDHSLRDAITDTLQLGGLNTLSVRNGLEALELMKRKQPDLIVSDMHMDHMGGLELLDQVKKEYPSIPLVMITAHGSVEKAVEAMRAGAADFLMKPFDAAVLLEMVLRICPAHGVESDGMIAFDNTMKKLCQVALKVAKSDATVLINGESGTGKEVMSRFLHAHSARSNQPFIAINCAAIPENMLESMLFGYEKGAYTGAHQSRAGKFEQANGGTLLLDEITEMDIGLQAKLLRVLQEREVERLGGNKLIPLDVRVLATTNRDLRLAVSEGRFREDLYYRLNVFPISLPPLRDRPADILPLARVLLQKTDGQICDFSAQAEARLREYPWPGNVRELENTLQRAQILCSGIKIELDDLVFESLEDIKQTTVPDAALDGNLKARESQLIVDALEAVGGSRKAAAEKLGISPRTLRYKLARLRETGTAVPAVAG